MSKANQDFVNFLKDRMPGDKIEQIWLEDAIEDYLSSPACSACNGMDLEIIVDAKVIFKCNECNHTTEGIPLDKIRPMDYNAVTFLHEDKIMAILEAQAQE